jgi:hypothetical protein
LPALVVAGHGLQRESTVTAPNVTIDFRRQFSLPVGVPPALALADLLVYCAELGADTGWLEYPYENTDRALTELDPGLPGDLRASLLTLAGGARAIVVPRSFAVSGLAAGAITRNAGITANHVKTIGLPAWAQVMPAPGEEIWVTNSARFRWDDTTKTASVLPQPFHSDESLALAMDPTAGGAAIGADLPGIAADDAAQHLLATAAAARDGELDPLVLRAPALGLARFDRYRHVEATLAGASVTAVSVRAQSAAGALLLRVLPSAITPPIDSLEPILKEHTLVFEHLAVDDVARCLGPLAWLQLVRFDELTAIKKFKDEVHKHCSTALRCWLAHGALGFGATGAGEIAEAVTAPFKKDAAASVDQVKAAIAAIMAKQLAKEGLRTFVTGAYASILAGKSWIEQGTAFPVVEANRPAALKWAHKALEGVMMEPHLWLVAYAGCPLGRPSALYRSATGLATADLLRRGLSTFDLEALVLAGRAGEVFPDVTAPALPALRTDPVVLTAYAGKARGYLAAVRVVEATRVRECTTRDWLRATIVGWHHKIRAPVPIDFDQFAAAGHPLARALSWAEFDAARTARASMDILHGTKVGAKTLSRDIVDFWIRAADLGPTWPVSQPGQNDQDLPAGPTDPYMPGETSRGIAGFDELDLDAALVASNFLRDGVDTTQKVALPVILALLDREGLRADSRWQRGGALSDEFRDNLNKDKDSDLSAIAVAKAGFQDGFARRIWTLNSFGLDVMDVPALTGLGGIAGVDDWKQFARLRVAEYLQRLLDAGVAVDLDPARVKEYCVARTIGRTHPVTKVLQAKLATRQLQWIGIVLQQGEFQRRHALIRRGPAAGELNSSWRPLVGGTTLTAVPEYAAPRPSPGANAEAGSRYAYLAYYSMLYLAFNGSPGLWNSWVNIANANRGVRSVTEYFLYKSTALDTLAGGRVPWHRGHALRFVTALDAYLRLTGPDTAAVGRADLGVWPI